MGLGWRDEFVLPWLEVNRPNPEQRQVKMEKRVWQEGLSRGEGWEVGGLGQRWRVRVQALDAEAGDTTRRTRV